MTPTTPIEDENAEVTTQHLLFVLGAETFAVHIAQVREIIEYAGVTTVPMMPPVLRGVINLRGRVVPVVDLSVRFGREPTTPGKRASVVIAEVSADDSKHLVGVMVNAVSEVVELPPSAIEPPPSFGASIRDAFISGIARHKDKFLVVLDVAKVLSVEELSSLDGQRTSH